MSVARQAILWQWGAFAYTIVASLFFAFMPLFADPSGGFVSAYMLLGWGVFVPLLLPMALALVPPLLRGRRRLLLSWVFTGVLGVLCLPYALSWLGVFLPAPLLGAIGAYLTGRAPIEDAEIVERPWQVPKA